MKYSYTIKKSLLLAAAIGTVAVPMLVSAAVKHDAVRSATVFYELGDGATARTPETLYERLKAEARKMCGPASIRVTGSIQRAAGNEACYEGTLEAAVERLDDPAVNVLHHREFAGL